MQDEIRRQIEAIKASQRKTRKSLEYLQDSQDRIREQIGEIQKLIHKEK